MAKVSVRAGRLIKVNNTKIPKLSHANKEYFAVWVEDADSKNERCLLFTENEIATAENRAKKNTEDLTKKNFFANLID